MARWLSRKAPDEFALDDWVSLLETRAGIDGHIDVSIACYSGKIQRLIPAPWRRWAGIPRRQADGVVAQIELIASYEEVVDAEMLPARIYQVLANCALEMKRGLPTGGLVVGAHSAGDDENNRHEEPESEKDEHRQSEPSDRRSFHSLGPRL